jgi:phosphate uptake regulator
MAGLVQAMLKDVLDAYASHDAEKAIESGTATRRSTRSTPALFRELLTYMMEDPRNITPCTHLLFIAKNIERIGDHATNIAEHGARRRLRPRLRHRLTPATTPDHCPRSLPPITGAATPSARCPGRRSGPPPARW